MEVTNGSTPPRSLGHAVPTESWDYVSQAAGEGSVLISFDSRIKKMNGPHDKARAHTRVKE
ncbi:hypothetical protein F9C07_2287272 [Aspergillus flavus]|uniref:Uncharacterized protein n=1 Tax=Aspergillus flavus (strain ATCC 200026 / FGSC A1120 / IAM 13836 / NRRL 3357 / JCM 12722 / SRRC 167) TaxID=332952 RepID=A0A7U2R1Q3_ASPFN|nr:hypothetical protein F9C07_2287272 [Aspergillus flavus]